MLGKTVVARTNVIAYSPIHLNEHRKVVWFADTCDSALSNVTHNSIEMKQNANSSIHTNEHGKIVWFVNDHAADSPNINPSFNRRLIHKPRVIPLAALNQT